MSLGKGLESLIPQKDGDSGNQGSNSFAGASSEDRAEEIIREEEADATPAVVPPPFTIHSHSDVPHEEPPRPQRPANEAVFHIEVSRIKPNPHQPRREFEESALRELASSIREFGVIQPLVVSKVETDLDEGTRVEYELIAGERRLMASRLAGLSTVPVIVRRAPSDREKLEVAVIENIQRRDLNAIETAKAFARLQDEFKLTQREIAARLGKSRESVSNAVRLLNLPLDIQEAVAAGRIGESQARLLLSFDDIGEQQRVFQEIIANNLSVREVKTIINRKKAESAPKKAPVNPETMALRERLEELLGTKVDLKDEGESGKITINFYSKEELRGIMDRMFGREPS